MGTKVGPSYGFIEKQFFNHLQLMALNRNFTAVTCMTAFRCLNREELDYFISPLNSFQPALV